MKILSYSDCHIGTKETLAELGLAPDFSRLAALVEIIKQESPDIVISVGDYWEPLYDKVIPIDSELFGLTDIFLSGNHDRGGLPQYIWQGICFMHGHKLHLNVAGEEERQRLYEQAEAHPHFVVLGHTHRPYVGKHFLDMGSLTITGTYAVCENGRPELRNLDNEHP